MHNKIKLHSIGTALLISILLTGCKGEVSQPDNSNPAAAGMTESETSISSVGGNQPEESYSLSESAGEQSIDNEQTFSNEETLSDEGSVPESPAEPEELSINRGVVWGMGKTFDEIAEKYGNITSGNFNKYSFEHGFGIYVWDWGDGIDNSETDRDRNISLVKERGGCVMIDGIHAKDFIIGDFSTLNYEDFASRCGIEYTHIDDDPTMLYDGCWWAYFKHPSYENVTFCMYTEERDVIDDTAGFVIRSDDF